MCEELVETLHLWEMAGHEQRARRFPLLDPEGHQSVSLPLPIPPPLFPAPSKPEGHWMPGWKGPIPHRSSGNNGNAGDDGGDPRCDAVEDECYEHCQMALDNCALPDMQTMNYHRCINQCMFDQNCGGQNYSDGWDNSRLGTPKPWQY